MSEKRYTNRPRTKRIDPAVITLTTRIVLAAVIVVLAFTAALWRSRAVEAVADISMVRAELKRTSAALSTEYERTTQLQSALYTTSLVRAGQAIEINSLEASLTALQKQLQKAPAKAPAKTTAKATPKTTATPIRAQVSPGVDQWRPLVTRHFKGNADAALRVMQGESHGDPRATNGPCWGLFQIDHEIHAAKIAEKARAWDMKADLFDPEFNIRFAAYMTNYGASWGSWTVQP